MGSYAYIYVDGYPIISTKNGIEQSVVDRLFLPEDKVSETRPNSALNKMNWAEESKKPGTHRFHGFRQTAGVCRTRLEIYGMNFARARADFAKARKIADNQVIYSFDIKRLSFKRYMEEVREIFGKRIYFGTEDFDDGELRGSLILSGMTIYGQDPVVQLYCLLTLTPDDAIVEYDLSDIVEGGWVEMAEVLPSVQEKIIVLTEGKSDTWLIQGTLKLLYPHLYHYYHFIDFDEFKAEGSASALAKLVLSFVAAGVQHPIIAIFDNDTAGISEMKRIPLDKLPPNIKVLKLPDLAFAKRYPTQGPTGIKNMNINGLATGIELFTGTDVLKSADGLIPVLWKGYHDKERKYQGEIKDEGAIQQLYKQKIASGTGDFHDMDEVLNLLFKAFQ